MTKRRARRGAKGERAGGPGGAAGGDRSPARRVASPPRRPLLIYDGECGFCRRWIARWRRMTGEGLDYEPSQTAAARFPEIRPEEFASAVQLVEPDGRVSSGAEAVFGSLAYAPSGGAWIWIHRRVPEFASVSAAFYELVARRRVFFSRLTRLLWGDHVERPEFRIARCLFPRLLGLVYLIAFVSLWVQVDGLIGSGGIMPVGPFLEAVRESTGPSRYWLVPTLCWISASDAFLHFLCGAGALLSVALMLGLLPGPVCLLLWACYLSLATVCRTFLGFQWDNLLLEAGFLAVLAAPWRWRCRLPCAGEAPRFPMFLVRWLLFRLMFLSGLVKLTSGDPTWRNLTALQFHYETQPLPTLLGWWAHQMPGWFQQASVVGMFAVELAVPFLIFAPRRARLAACATLVGLQAVFAATGNFAFFNLLTVVLCVALVDDASWPARLRRRLDAATGGDPSGRKSARSATVAQRRPAARLWAARAVAALGAAILVVSIVEGLHRVSRDPPVPRPLEALAGAVSPLRTVNAYGLFAVMTTSRPEIVVEGSDDGRAWRAYGFRWKPGDPARRPRWVAPHQPRLDWQMWFAALGDYRANDWFMAFLVRLLEGSPDVLALLESSPFPDAPPRYVRAVVWDYRFTEAGSEEAGVAWWRREAKGLYCPVLTRDPDGRIRVAGGEAGGR